MELEARLMLQKRREKDRICDSRNGHGSEFSYKTTIANLGAAVPKIDEVIGCYRGPLAKSQQDDRYLSVEFYVLLVPSLLQSLLSHLSLKTEASYCTKLMVAAEESTPALLTALRLGVYLGARLRDRLLVQDCRWQRDMHNIA